MKSDIETYDKKRRLYTLGIAVIAILILIITLIEFFLNASGARLEEIRYYTIPAYLIIFVCGIAVSVGNSLLNRRIEKNPKLNEALNNELVMLNKLKAWKSAFFVLAGFVLFFGLLSSFFAIDGIYAALTSVVGGLITYNITFLILDR
jgi:hypothetical protein